MRNALAERTDQRTVIRKSTGAEKLMPLLLAETETLFVPRGHVIVGPGLVPHPPDHDSVASAQRFGSENPSCAADSVAPPDELASTVMVVGPPKSGSVCCTAPAASTRPEPERLSG